MSRLPKKKDRKLLMTKYTQEEISFLKQINKSSPKAYLRRKAQALLLQAKGYTREEIREIVEVKKSQLGVWIWKWNKAKQQSFKVKPKNQGQSYLTQAVRKEIKGILRTKKPKDLGLEASYWSTRLLKVYLQAKYQVTYKTDKSIRDLFKEAGMSSQKPIVKDIHQDEAKRIEFIGRVKKRPMNITGRVMLSW